jgi:hypothetical protein
MSNDNEDVKRTKKKLNQNNNSILNMNYCKGGGIKWGTSKTYTYNIIVYLIYNPGVKIKWCTSTIRHILIIK